jgi:hypothetical protein
MDAVIPDSVLQIRRVLQAPSQDTANGVDGAVLVVPGSFTEINVKIQADSSILYL